MDYQLAQNVDLISTQTDVQIQNVENTLITAPCFALCVAMKVHFIWTVTMSK
ncbi:hypothetical protein [Anaerotignum neopropionicum]|uniref:hypothetical protein n=1 Tax=Anaerotignum neopropionicum TaxID=36847 RepID=UPI0012FD97CF|nr:hypothetical protein [Anaerotignum neopropionicum]